MTEQELDAIIDNIHFTKDYEENLTWIVKLSQLETILGMTVFDMVHDNKCESTDINDEFIETINRTRLPIEKMIIEIKDEDKLAEWNYWFKKKLFEVIDSLIQINNTEEVRTMIFYILIQEDKEDDD